MKDFLAGAFVGLILTLAIVAIFYLVSSLRTKPTLTIPQAIETLEVAKESHLYYSENPDKITWTSNVTNELAWVDRYDDIIELLEGLK